MKLFSTSGLLALAVLFLLAVFFFRFDRIEREHQSTDSFSQGEETGNKDASQEEMVSPNILESNQREPEKEPAEPLPATVRIPGVPFVVQAPFAEWSDPVFQNACEEASLVMAQAWISGTVLTKESAKQEIWALSMYEKKEFGHSVDTSIQDTASLLDQYYNTQTFQVHSGIQIADIQKAIAEHRLVMVPTDGRKLKNPNFTQPGPPRHMVVIVGYDSASGEFIVNDPGTRKGEGYRYPEAILYEAILDYPTGEHVPVTSADKVMLTVWRD